MAKQTTIEWTDASWNPWHGCIKVSPGCKNCYMYRGKRRFGNNPRKVVRSKTTFRDPIKWRQSTTIFTCSWSDWFIEDADLWRDDAWEVIRRTPQHVYQILTKRPERIVGHLPLDWGNGWNNVWLGVSIESQEYLYRKDILVDIPANIRFLSLEPLLGPIDLGKINEIHWIITGGESGSNARPMLPEWAIDIKDQCLRNEIAFFHKQNGGNKKIDGAWGSRLLQDREWNGMPALLPSSQRRAA